MSVIEIDASCRLRSPMRDRRPVMNRQNHLVSVGAAYKVVWPLSLHIALELAPPWALAMNILAWTERALRADENFCFISSRPGRRNPPLVYCQKGAHGVWTHTETLSLSDFQFLMKYPSEFAYSSRCARPKSI
jgi:hypothetical protein